MAVLFVELMFHGLDCVFVHLYHLIQIYHNLGCGTNN